MEVEVFFNTFAVKKIKIKHKYYGNKILTFFLYDNLLLFWAKIDIMALFEFYF